VLRRGVVFAFTDCEARTILPWGDERPAAEVHMSSVAPAPILYPDSDGMPMSDNTLQFRWIVTLQGGLDDLFRDRPDVFVAGDLLWYPVEGHPEIRQAPDAMVVFGRPKGYRGSYMQWVEGNIAPQVVFEVLSPGNRPAEMDRKFQFYDRHGVEEYYIYDPDGPDLTGWRRVGVTLEEIPEMNGWVSPRLGIRFDLSSGELQIFRPDGRRFATYLELAEQREYAEQRAERLAAQLRALGVDPEK
jgi:Uma2 family endonuclease